jgi:DNA polymerase-3 subunit gamma/tau
MVDVIEIDAASNTGVDNIREVLENAQYAPTSGKFKVYIIDEVHMLSKSAFNAMLKTLEEPPAHIIFILATTDPQKVPITVLSRCLQLKLRNLSPSEIAKHLANILQLEQISYEDEALNLIAQTANGSMRDALSLTDQAIAYAGGEIKTNICRQMLGLSDEEVIYNLLELITAGNSAGLVTACNQLAQSGANLEEVLEQINFSLFQIGLAQLSPQSNLPPRLLQLAPKISLQDCQLYFEISNLGREQIEKFANKFPIFVMTLLRMVAFTIGSESEKQLIISANNCTTQVAPTAAVANVQVVPPEISHAATIEVTSPIAPIITEPEPEPAKLTVIPPSSPPWEESKPAVAPVTQAAEPAPSIATSAAAPTSEARSVPPPQPAAEMPPRAVGNCDWLNFAASLDLAQLSPEIAVIIRNSAQLPAANPEELNLVISDTFRDLVTANCVDTLEQMLFAHYQQHLDINFNFTQAEYSGSLKEHEEQKAKQRQHEAEMVIQSDPIIKDLVDNFSAKIVPNSIKPL